MYTCSYDGSLRAFDLNATKVLEVWAGSDADNVTLSAMDVLSLGVDGAAGGASPYQGADTVIVGAYDGQVMILDARVHPAERSMAWQAHGRKVCAVSAVTGTHFVASASGDAQVHVWDVRRTKQSVSSAVCSVASVQAMTSACFSPRGKYLVSTCNENKLRVWHVSACGTCSARAWRMLRSRPRWRYAGLQRAGTRAPSLTRVQTMQKVN